MAINQNGFDRKWLWGFSSIILWYKICNYSFYIQISNIDAERYKKSIQYIPKEVDVPYEESDDYDTTNGSPETILNLFKFIDMNGIVFFYFEHLFFNTKRKSWNLIFKGDGNISAKELMVFLDSDKKRSSNSNMK